MANQKIKREIYNSGIKQWEVAEKFGLSEGVFSRRMRHELSEKDKARILEIINELTAEKDLAVGR